MKAALLNDVIVAGRAPSARPGGLGWRGQAGR